MSDLRDVLQNRAHGLANSMQGADEFDVNVAIKSVRRKRVVRGALVTGGTFVTVLAVGFGAWAGYDALRPAPPASQTPSPSASATSEPSVTPSPSVTPEPEHQIVSGADVAILERLQNPTTGETWHEPRAIDDPGTGLDGRLYYEVGNRGDASIVVAVPESFMIYTAGYGIEALFEVTSDELRWISCPSARATDPCTPTYGQLGANVVIDTTTHYDSLTYPATTSPAPGWALRTAPDADSTNISGVLLGTANTFPGISLSEDYEKEMAQPGERTVLAELGASTLVEWQDEGLVPGTTSVRFAIETPFGSDIWLTSWNGHTWRNGPANGAWYAAQSVVWDDGKDTFGKDERDEVHRPIPATQVCFAPDEVLINSFDVADWRKAGTHSQGADVYLPVEGGNDVAKATWTWLKENSWAEQVDSSLAYPYKDYSKFLTDRSVFAWERPDGQWVLAISSKAEQTVYECA